MSKDAEEYGEEDQPLRWARCCNILEKRGEYHLFGDGEK
jgi:hypothetical protein